MFNARNCILSTTFKYSSNLKLCTQNISRINIARVCLQTKDNKILRNALSIAGESTHSVARTTAIGSHLNFTS